MSRIDAARLTEQGDRSYTVGEVENDLAAEVVAQAPLLVALWSCYPGTIAEAPRGVEVCAPGAEGHEECGEMFL